MQKIGIVGAGIVGLAVALRIAETRDAEITVLEKESDVGMHQTGHNSGVVHAGVYYTPGSLKAALCVRGARLMKEFCAQHEIVVEEIGKLVVATDSSEVGRLDDLEVRAHANNVPGLRRIGASEITEIEPEVRGVSALYSPHTAIVDFSLVARRFAGLLEEAGHVVLRSTRVDAIHERNGHVEVRAGNREFAFDHLIVCAGLGTNDVTAMLGEKRGVRIVPFRGEYYRLDHQARSLVRGLIYPVPDPRYPFLGVHFTPNVSGEVFIGPNAVLATAIEGYRRSDVNAREVAALLSWPGAWRLARQNLRTGAYELAGSLSKRVFVNRARRYVPSLRASQVTRSAAGVRAQAVDQNGRLIDDFVIHQTKALTLVQNAPSPAATSSLAIAEHIVEALPS